MLDRQYNKDITRLGLAFRGVLDLTENQKHGDLLFVPIVAKWLVSEDDDINVDVCVCMYLDRFYCLLRTYQSQELLLIKLLHLF